VISDVLSDARENIERYQRDMPDAYDVLAPEIASVLTVMGGLRLYLDIPPNQMGEHGKLVEDLRRAIRTHVLLVSRASGGSACPSEWAGPATRETYLTHCSLHLRQ